ncbi:MAG: DUF3347 domain-containing protein [Cyclobacteriaceae bacterium]
MKKQNLSILPILLLSLLVFPESCSAPSKEKPAEEVHMTGSDEEPAPPSEPRYQTEEVFRVRITDIFNVYVELKDAMVKGDLDSVKSSGLKMSEMLANTDPQQLRGAAQLDWKMYSEGLVDYLTRMKAAPDIASSRNLLQGLTENMYNTIKAFGLNGVAAYYAYCPMAFNNRGGYWLSDEKKIRNPYFGDAMLECGDVREQLK